MRATKITKYFQYENNNPLNFFPIKQNNETTNSNLKPKLNNEITLETKSKHSSISSSSFDTINIQLVTKYYTCGSTVEYSLYFNNGQLDINGSITNVGTIVDGDLLALHETLKYIVYHPNMSKKINKYKFNIYTNSKNICDILKPGPNILANNIYPKIQSLIKCINNISIEYWNN